MTQTEDHIDQPLLKKLSADEAEKKEDQESIQSLRVAILERLLHQKTVHQK